MASNNNKDSTSDDRLMLSLRSYLRSPTSSSSTIVSDHDDDDDDDDNNNNRAAAEARRRPNNIQLILASQSPRRREILNLMGLEDRYTVQVSPSMDETSWQQQLSQDDPVLYTKTLAEQKAQAIGNDLLVVDQQENSTERCSRPTIVLAADTIVVTAFDQTKMMILEKPTSTTDALRMLSQLSGRAHVVHTAVAVLIVLPPNDCDDEAEGTRVLGPSSSSRITVTSFVDTAHVQFTSVSNADLNAYVASGEPLDKAGAYGIQGLGGQLIESITGDYFTVRFDVLQSFTRIRLWKKQKTTSMVGWLAGWLSAAIVIVVTFFFALLWFVFCVGTT
jgi:septum formation protein